MRGGAFSLWVFYAGIFLAAFLSFAIQPLTGRHILPLVGGTPQGWLVVLAFFQSTLMAGYALVHISRRVDARIVTCAVAAALSAAAWLLPEALPQATLSGGGQLYIFLWQWLGLPMVALGTTAPLLQRLFFAAGGYNPYWLYAISNTGSLLGLLAYPFFIEPFFGLQAQGDAWRHALWVLAGAAAVAAALSAREIREDEAAEPKPDARAFMRWAALAALPASLLSGTTMLISTDVGSFPLLWVSMLAAYLLTFIMAFRDTPVFSPAHISTAFLIVAVFLLLGRIANPLDLSSGLQVFELDKFAPLGFFLAALLCHTRLYDTRPHPAHLSYFYVAVATGGAIGGGINAFVVPALLPVPNEFFIVLALCVLATQAHGTPSAKLRAYSIGACAIIVGIVSIMKFIPIGGAAAITGGIILCVAFLLSLGHLRAAMIAALFCLGLEALPHTGLRTALHQERNFFGVLRVREDAKGTERMFLHGTTLHGAQPADMAWQGVPVGYYGPASPIGRLMHLYQTGDIAAVGLGTGQMACYANARRFIDFYEIDADVVRIAQRWFNYLDLCGYRDMVMGDARLKLAQTARTYDIIALDAFSSDSIPVHLLTVEAINAYLARLAPRGAIAFHVSNRFYNLVPPLAANAEALGLYALELAYTPDKTVRPYDLASVWVVLTRDSALAGTLHEAGWRTPESATSTWRDDYSPLLGALYAPVFLKKP